MDKPKKKTVNELLLKMFVLEGVFQKLWFQWLKKIYLHVDEKPIHIERTAFVENTYIWTKPKSLHHDYLLLFALSKGACHSTTLVSSLITAVHGFSLSRKTKRRDNKKTKRFFSFYRKVILSTKETSRTQHCNKKKKKKMFAHTLCLGQRVCLDWLGVWVLS